MGITLMHEAWKRGVKKFVQIGTVCSYPKHTPVPFQVDDLWNGYPEETNAPYGIAKKALLTMGQAYRQQYGFNVIHLIPTNLYGPGDNFDLKTSHVIPALIRRMIEARDAGQESIEAWGDGTPTRDFLYIDDAVRGIIAATEKYNKPTPLNLGSNQETSMKDLVDEVAMLVNYEGRIHWDATKPNGQPRRLLSTEGVNATLQWWPDTPHMSGLRNTVGWYERNRE